jgi:5-methylcytosine-specific restriction protein A
LSATRVKTLQPSIRTVNLQRVSNLEVERLRGSGLQKRNARLAMARPLCVECERIGEVRAAEVWDHIHPLHLGGPDVDSNLQGLCKDHHDEKSAREAAARAQRAPGG